MSLMMELSPEQELRLAAAARQRGVAPAELAQELLAEKLPELSGAHTERPPSNERDPELLARVRSIRGKYAHLGVTTEELHRDRRADKKRDER